MSGDPLYVLAFLSALVAVSEWLARRTVLRHFGAALVVIVLTAIAVNVRVIPPYRDDQPVYGAVFEHVAPLGIFWLLLQVDLRSVLRAGLPMLTLFAVGAIGTVCGVLVAMWAVDGRVAFGALHHALGGMFVGTYVGGSVNFNAVALEYRVIENGALYAGAAAVDAAMTTVWMAATVALPRLLAPFWPVRQSAAPGVASAPASPEPAAEPGSAAAEPEAETLRTIDLAAMLALGVAGVWLSRAARAALAEHAGVDLPEALILTTVALLLAQLPAVQRMRGARLCGLCAVYLFLAVIGALCDLSAVRQIGDLAARLSVFVTLIVAVHAVFAFGAAWLLRIDAPTAAVASQANIGGGTSALALARSLARPDLVLPAILVGALGNAVGNYLGLATAAWLAD